MRSIISQLSIHKLEVFCEVAQLKSISRAAERIGIAQPVVSSHIKTMSQKLGTTLIQRDGRRIRLTEDGHRVLKWAQEVINRTHELERELIDIKSGHLGKATVGASMTIGSFILPAMITNFRQRYAKAEISVHVATPAVVTNAVQDGECDFAFTILDPRLDTSRLKIDVVGEERLLLVASGHSSIIEHSISPEKLNDLWFVTAQTGTHRRDLEEDALRRFGIFRSKIAVEFGHAEAIKQAVRAGNWVAFLFDSSIKDELASGVLREIKTPGMELRIPFYLVRRQGRQLNKYQTNLMTDLKNALLAYSADSSALTIDGA